MNFQRGQSQQYIEMEAQYICTVYAFLDTPYIQFIINSKVRSTKYTIFNMRAKYDLAKLL